MSRITSYPFTVNHHPSALLVNAGDYDTYKTALYNVCASRWLLQNDPKWVGTKPQPLNQEAYFVFGLDHALGFWFDLFYSDQDEPVFESYTVFPLGHNCSKRQMLDLFVHVLRETEAGMTPDQVETLTNEGNYVEHIENTIIDPRAIRLILRDLDPERYTMFAQNDDYGNEAAYIIDTHSDIQGEIEQAVTRLRQEEEQIDNARQGAHD
jgi:hypothetical protein